MDFLKDMVKEKPTEDMAEYLNALGVEEADIAKMTRSEARNAISARQDLFFAFKTEHNIGWATGKQRTKYKDLLEEIADVADDRNFREVVDRFDEASEI